MPVSVSYTPVLTTPEACLAELSTLAPWMSKQDWQDFVAQPLYQQQLEIQGYKSQEWTKPGSSTLDKVLTVLGVLGTFIGFVTGAAGAAQAVASLKNL